MPILIIIIIIIVITIIIIVIIIIIIVGFKKLTSKIFFLHQRTEGFAKHF